MIAITGLIAELGIILIYTTLHSHVGLSEYQLSLPQQHAYYYTNTAWGGGE